MLRMRRRLDFLRGQAALEFAAILIPLLLSSGLVIDGARLFLAYTEAAAAASDIARLAASQSSSESGFDAQSYASNMGLSSGATVTVEQSSDGIDELDGLSYIIEGSVEEADAEEGSDENVAADASSTDESLSDEDESTSVEVYAQTASFTCTVTVPVTLIFPLWNLVPGISQDLTGSSFLISAEAVAYATVERTGEVVS